MLVSILIGLVAAGVASAPQLFARWVQNFWDIEMGLGLRSPLLIIAIALVAVLLQKFLKERKDGSITYCGFSDMMIHIYSPATPDSPARWTVHGIISLLFAVFGGVVGTEGAAAEIAHSCAMRIQSRSARWFEQRRRSDAATAVSAAIAATFHAPFAAVLFPLELGMGGRTLSALLSALTAYLTVEFFSRHLGFEHFYTKGALDGFHFSGWASWVSPCVIGVIIGVLGAALIRAIRYSEEAVQDLFPLKKWMRPLFAGGILALAAFIYKPAHVPSWVLIENVFWARHTLTEACVLLLGITISLIMVIAGFGTLGILSPLFAMGGILGFGFNQWIWNAMPGFSTAAGFAGVAAIWGAVMGTPLSVCVLVFEMTGNQQLLFPCLIAAFVAREVRILFSTPALYQFELASRGMKLIEGRSAEVLESLTVKEAMVIDQEMVHEHQDVADIYQSLQKSPYAFLPVVTTQGKYLGILTADVIQEAWDTREPDQIVSKLVGAKDLLYRSKLKVSPIQENDSLSASAGIFRDFPCVPVVSDEDRVVGLLFVHSVRLAYDREVARRSLSVGVIYT
jgi:CIC family chloride channel protein